MKVYSVLIKCPRCDQVIDKVDFALESEGYRVCFILPSGFNDVETFLHWLEDKEITVNTEVITFKDMLERVKGQRNKAHRNDAVLGEDFDYYLSRVVVEGV